MPTKLTKEGWIGATTGKWSPTSPNKIIDSKYGIILTYGVSPQTGARGLTLDGTAISGQGWGRTGVDIRTGAAIYSYGRTLITGKGDYIGFSNYGGIYINSGSRESNDQITGISTKEYGVAFENYGEISTGSGNDKITGIGRNGAIAIRNGGTIYMGAGNDTVDASRGGFTGGGLIDMGDGMNTLIGFGEQTVDGGGNKKSRVLLNQGKYTVTTQSDGFLISMFGDKSELVMDVFGFGLIGGVAKPLGTIELRSGTLTIAANGSASFF